MKQSHSNRRHFEGICTRLGVPSDAAPSGSRGHRIIIPAEVARAALESLIGAPVGFGSCWGIHNYRQRCGVITETDIRGDGLWVSGHLFDADYPEVGQMMEKGKLGMSIELDDAHVVDLREEVWTLSRVTFRGAALLLADKAAYRTTSVRLSAAAMAEMERADGFQNNPNQISFDIDINRIVFEGYE